ncbi:MAG: T9SS type A sorting domain-containing protein [Lewinellaceae bacterium]|nr:T9SS type A sorting domain-containing protein [Lewinellaceae bacterium]
MPDNSFIVFGRKLYRKINYDRTTGFTQEWARNTGAVWPIAVAQHNNRLILADEKGQLQALDADGNQVWLRSHTTQFRALKVLSDGFAGCGVQSNGVPIVLRMDFDGQEMWSAGYSGAIFHDIIRTSDGGYAVAGLSDNSEMILLKLDAQGAVTWTQNYGDAGNASGGSSDVLELPDGGFLLLARGKTAVHCIRTDAQGNAPEADDFRVGYRQLKNTALQADFFPEAGLFFNGSAGTFLALEDSVTAPTILAYSPWIAGKDPGGNLRVAAADFISSSIPDDYRTGGVATLENEFDRVWAINRAQLRAMREDFRLDNSLDDPVPLDIITWPGKGNPNLKYNLDFSPVQTNPDHFPAPFVDVNNDGRYNVYDGDYPVLKGDQMVWWAFTDSTKHGKTFTDPMLVDFQVAAYTYDCLPNPLLEKSLFVDYTLINRSGNTYAESYLGFFTDPDLGCHFDDFIGSAPQADAWYVYNADADDDDSCSGRSGFGTTIPVQTVQYLNHSLNQSMYYANPSVSNPPPGITDPKLAAEYYNYLRGYWRDGKPLTRGGTGYDPGSTDTVKFVFPDNPANPQGWTMCTGNLPYANRRVINTHGPFNFGAADTFRLEVAFTRHSNIPHPCPDIFGLVVPPLQQLKQWHTDGALNLQTGLAPVYTIGSGQTIELDASVPGGSYNWSTGSIEPIVQISAPGNYTVTITGQTGCAQVENILVQTGVSTGEPQLPEWKIWPNPASGQLLVSCPECDAASTRALLYNAQGQLVRQQAELSKAMDVHSLPPGVYWLELRDARGWLGVKRVVVAR